MDRPDRRGPARPLGARSRLIAVAVASCYASAPVWALNEADLKAVAGSFTASQTGNVNVLTLTTSTSRTIAEAPQRFNVGANEQLRVLQPSSSSLFLLRVMPGQSGALERSVIDGSIYSNGQFWLQNGAGVMIGRGAVIDTAGFLATNMAVRMEDFMAARLTSLQNIGGGGGIVNQGEIKTSSGGSVYLIGDKVTNEGIIKTPDGETILAAGQTVSLVDTGTPGVKVEITGEQGDVTNLGEIVATAGRIGMAGVIVKNSGTLNASSVVSEGGRVFLKASKDAYVDGAGRIVATGTKGGTVEVLGERVAVMDQARIDVSGSNGGGTVLVGGDYQGKNSDVRNATVTYFGREASIKADATDNGDGGKVIVWADDTTRAYGNISVRGGENGGDGGFVETSGHRYLDFHANVDRRAPKGSAGTLLLDPADVTISNAVTASGSFTGGVFSSSDTPSTLSWSDIITQLGSGNVVVTTTYGGGGTGNITISASPSGGATVTNTHEGSCCSYTGVGYTSTNKLSLLAHNAVNINAWFGNAYGGGVPAGAIDIYAGWDGASTSTPVLNSYAVGRSINIASGAGIATKGALTLKAVDAINITAGASYAGIDLDTGDLTVWAEKLTLTGGGAGDNARAFISTNGKQTFTLGTNSASGGLLLQGGSGAYYGGAAQISLYNSSEAQSFTIQNGAKVELKGGSQTALTTSFSGDCSAGAGCAGADAEIRNSGNGGQSFTFTNGGTLNVYGGSGGTRNGADIENNGTGTQTITASAGSLNISLYGGTGGGNTAVYGGKTVEFDNSAGIEAKGSQTISAATLAMYGGSASYGGAFVTAPTQNITLSGALTMAGGDLGGRGSAPTAFDTYGDAVFYNPVVIGHDAANTINLSVGSLTMTGGSSSNYGGSMALIGGYRVSSNVSLSSSGNIALNGANTWGERIGSFGGYGGSVSMTTTTSGASIMLDKSYIGTGSTGSVTLSSYGGVTQSALGRIETNTLTAAATDVGAGIDLSGENKATNVTASALGAITYNSVMSTLISSMTSTSAGITVNVTNPYSYGGTVSLGTLSAANSTVSVTAAQQILDDNGTGTGNITAQGITLVSTNGTTDSSGIAISADVAMSGGAKTISATVNNTANYGGISIRNGTSTAPLSVSMTDQSTTAGHAELAYLSAYDINMTTGAYNLSSNLGGVTFGTTGNLTLSSLATMLPGINDASYRYIKMSGQNVATSTATALVSTPDLYINANGTLTVGSGHNITAARNVGLNAVGGLTMTNSAISASANVYLGGVNKYGGGAITLTNSSVSAGNGIYAYTGGDIRLNDGSYLSAAYDVGLGLGGTNSIVYLNDTTGYSASYILAGAGYQTYLAFSGRSADGVVIDGATTMTSTAYGSGIFVGGHGTPATKGAGLTPLYGLAASAAVNQAVNDVVSTITTTTTSAVSAVSDSSTSSPTTANIPPPTTTTGTSGGLTSLSSGTVGGAPGEFGDTSSATGTTTTGTTSGDASTSGTGGATSGESGQSSTSGDQANGKDGEKKDDKKEDKKDDKSKKAESGEKKDDKASKKPVGKCSA